MTANTMITAAATDVQADWVYETVATDLQFLTDDDLMFCAALSSKATGLEPLGFFV